MNKALPAALGTALTAAFVLFAILAEPAYADALLTDLVPVSYTHLTLPTKLEV